MPWTWDAHDHRVNQMGEFFEHRSVNRGCGRHHYGYRDDCERCQETKRKDDEIYKAWKEAKEKKDGSKDRPN